MLRWPRGPFGRAVWLEPREAHAKPRIGPRLPGRSLLDASIDRRFWAARLLKLKEANEKRPPGQTIRVAVVDSGVAEHPALGRRVLQNAAYHFIGPDRGPGAPDEDTHGTYLAGLIAGEMPGEVQAACLAARILPLKFFDNITPGVPEDAALCIRRAVDDGARVINCSFDFFQDWGELRDAIGYARRKSVLVVAAAGNNGDDNDALGDAAPLPARYARDFDNVMAVASTFLAVSRAGHRFEGLSDFSNYGAKSVQVAAPGGNYGDVAPPGEDPMPLRLGVYGLSTVDNYVVRYGTSPAAALASGIAALVRLRWPGLTPRQVIERLIRTSDPIAGLRGKCVAGGRLNALAAVS